MRAIELMITPVLCTPTTTARQVATMMKQLDTGVILVVEDINSRKLIGLITDRDLILRLPADRAPENMTIEECMTRGNLLCCKPQDDIKQILEVMARRHVRRVPVVGEGSTVEGIIDDRVLLDYAVTNDPDLCLALARVISSKTRIPGSLNSGISFP